MLCDTDLKVSWRARPRTFVALMSLYESNHVRFMRLAGDPARLRGTLVSRVEGDCELQLSVLAHMPYTSTLALTYVMPAAVDAPNGTPLARVPDLRLRAYHDARLLEVESAPAVPAGLRLRPGGRQAERELRQRWARNMMLNKWLEYCVERGHRFT